MSSSPPPGMANCSICGRNFNEDRIEKHMVICQKASTKKRKVFDATKHRVQVMILIIYFFFNLKQKTKKQQKRTQTKKYKYVNSRARKPSNMSKR